MTELPAVLTVEEAAGVLRIGRGAAYEAVRNGEIPSVRLGRSIRVPRRALLEMLGEPAPEMRTPAIADGREAGVREVERAGEP